jgi:hypothetical protein
MSILGVGSRNGRSKNEGDFLANSEAVAEDEHRLEAGATTDAVM